jgi:hypothetical protein
MNIQKKDIGVERMDRQRGGVGGGGFSDHFHFLVGGEELAEALAGERFVVDN